MKYKSKTNQEGRVEKERIVKLPKNRISKMWRKRKERRTVVNIVRMYILKIEEKENGTSLEREREARERKGVLSYEIFYHHSPTDFLSVAN